MGKKFYDIHCHVMNLSHPNFNAFISRFNLTSLRVPILNLIPLTFLSIVGSFSVLKYPRVLNMLSLMEHSACDYFLKLEEDYLDNGKIVIADKEYDKVLLCPLMMDFGAKDYKSNSNIYYKYNHKFIVDQVTDLFNGIREYKNHPMSKNKLEIFPFFGITAANYTDTEITQMLNKYFGTFTLKDRYNKLLSEMGSFNGIVDDNSPREYSFAGIKVYPPLGFDPYPEKLEKVRTIYEKCIEKNIPIITHCGDKGYCSVSKDEYRKFTSPERWEQVLKMKEYKNLKICFAHYGKKFGDKWFKKISRLMDEYDNVYADISCRCFNDKDYKKLYKKVEKINKKCKNDLWDKIIFGSDVMMNLMTIDSYKDYLKAFSDTNEITDAIKEKISEKNPEKFLFG